MLLAICIQILQDIGDTGKVAYSLRHMNRKLEEIYGNHIFFAEVLGWKKLYVSGIWPLIS